jgi:ribosomal-protein-alanine N-acetyltransferase
MSHSASGIPAKTDEGVSGVRTATDSAEEWSLGEMTPEAARTIAGWRYPEPYAFYNIERDATDLAEFLDPARWRIGELGERDTIVAAYRLRELCGYFSFAGDRHLCTIGLGLAPAMTGRSMGEGFVTAGLAFAVARWRVSRFRLEVAAFNHRAITVYKRLGFDTRRSLVREDGGDRVEFLEMVR